MAKSIENKKGSDIRKLRILIRRLRNERIQHAIACKGILNNSEAGQLKYFADLDYLIRRTTKPKRTRFIIAVAIITFIVVGALGITKKGKTQIELSGSVSGVEYSSQEMQLIIGETKAAVLGASGLTSIISPRIPGISEELSDNSIESDSILLQATSSEGNMTISEVVISADAWVWFGFLRQNDQLLLSVKNGSIAAKAILQGKVSLIAPSFGQQKLDLKTPKAFQLFGDNGETSISFTPVSSDESYLTQNVRGIRFIDITQLIGRDISIVQKVSTLANAKLRLLDIGDKVIEIRGREFLHMSDSSGLLELRSNEQNYIDVRFAGIVHRLRMSVGNVTKSVMPSILEWLASQRIMYLFWGAVVYIVALVAGLIRWWHR